MPRYIIERDLIGAGALSGAELQSIARKSCEVLDGLGPRVQWQESFVTDDKIYCVYIAPDEASIRRHGELGGFPVTRVAQVKQVIGPTTAEGTAA